MNTRLILYVLSAVSLLFGTLLLISEITLPSTDGFTFARNVALSAIAIAVGVVAPLLSRKFSQPVDNSSQGQIPP
ncbi:hypothetical protein [Pyrobaculum sp.]|uniref:hypothetical protein n=1 Tax=Pyrobaculum sp. TaxID=2004705 RepID=UPI0031671003